MDVVEAVGPVGRGEQQANKFIQIPRQYRNVCSSVDAVNSPSRDQDAVRGLLCHISRLDVVEEVGPVGCGEQPVDGGELGEHLQQLGNGGRGERGLSDHFKPHGSSEARDAWHPFKLIKMI